MIKKIISAFFVLSFAFLVSSCGEKTNEAEYVLEITAYKTENSDCFLLETQDKNILIDTSNKKNGRKIARYLKEKGVNRIDLLIISSLQEKYTGGLPAIINKIKIENIITPKKSDIYKDVNNTNVIEITKETNFNINDLYFNIKENNNIISASLIHGKNQFIFSNSEIKGYENSTQKDIFKSQNSPKNFNILGIISNGEKLLEK